MGGHAVRDAGFVTKVGRLAFLDEDGKRAIYEAALAILHDVGMRLDHDEGRELMVGGGAELDGEERVRVPADMVADARESAPAAVEVFDRAGRPALHLGGHRCHFGTGSDLMNLYDLETGERRPASLDDVGSAARLVDALDNLDFVMSSAYAHELDASRAYLAAFATMVTNTVKPIVTTAEHAGDLAAMRRIAALVRGGDEPLAAMPYFVVYDQPSSPLTHPAESIDKLLFCADAGVPVIYSPAPLAGATAPLTAAGHVAQGTAEALFGLVLHQLRAPGAPFLFGIGPAVLDMQTMQSSYNAPEYLKAYAGAVEMAKWLDLPNWGYAGTSDAQSLDAQAGMEAGELTLLSLLLGSNLNHDIGYLDFGLTGSFEQIVLTDEFLALNRRLLDPIEVNEETLALDVVAAVGPGGDFVSQRHTARHMRSAQWRPTVLNRLSHDRWRDDGAPDARERARRKALRLLAEHTPPPLDAGLLAGIAAVAEAYGR
jgi:trimethylamine--corrinoid protein Co-methyltransferase